MSSKKWKRGWGDESKKKEGKGLEQGQCVYRLLKVNGKKIKKNHILQIAILYYFPQNICLAPTRQLILSKPNPV